MRGEHSNRKKVKKKYGHRWRTMRGVVTTYDGLCNAIITLSVSPPHSLALCVYVWYHFFFFFYSSTKRLFYILRHFHYNPIQISANVQAAAYTRIWQVWCLSYTIHDICRTTNDDEETHVVLEVYYRIICVSVHHLVVVVVATRTIRSYDIRGAIAHRH